MSCEPVFFPVTGEGLAQYTGTEVLESERQRDRQSSRKRERERRKRERNSMVYSLASQ